MLSRLPLLLGWACQTVAATSLQSTALSSIPDLWSTNTCLRRSVHVYTSQSSTFMVTDLGTSSLAPAISICPNVSTATIYETSIIPGTNLTLTTAIAASTLTVYQSPAAPSPSTQQVAAVGFENGSSLPSNSASSGLVTAEVASAGPLQPHSGDNYLLITFGVTPSPGSIKRQSQARPAYNVTQSFSATAGLSYVLLAYSSVAQNGDVAPDCSLTICGEADCSSPFPITPAYRAYSWTYIAQDDIGDAIATFSVQCAAAAYVAIDDISIVASEAGSLSTTTRTITQIVTQTPSPSVQLQQTTRTISIVTTLTIRETSLISGSENVPTQAPVVQTQETTLLVPFTTVQTLTTTAFISGSNIVFTTTVPSVFWSTSTIREVSIQSSVILVPITTTQTVTSVTSIAGSNTTFTTLVPTVLYSTSTVREFQTQFVNRTATETTLAWSTATIEVPNTQWMNITISDLRTTTVTQTSILNITTTQNQPPSLITETIVAVSTAIVTLTSLSLSELQLPVSTIRTTELTTLLLTTTLFQPSIVLETITATTTSLVVETQFSSLPGETRTTREETTLVLTNTPFNNTIISVPPRATEVQTSLIYSTIITYISITLPQATESIQFTLPQATFTPDVETTYITRTLDPIVVTSIISTTPPPLTQILTATLPQATFTPFPDTTYITRTLDPITITSVISLTPPPFTEVLTQTLPQATYTPFAETVQLTQTTSLPGLNLTITQTLPPQIVTTSLQGLNLTITETRNQTLPPSTIVQISTVPGPISTTTLPASTILQATTLPPSTIFTNSPTVTATATITAADACAPAAYPYYSLSAPDRLFSHYCGSQLGYDGYFDPGIWATDEAQCVELCTSPCEIANWVTYSTYYSGCDWGFQGNGYNYAETDYGPGWALRAYSLATEVVTLTSSTTIGVPGPITTIYATSTEIDPCAAGNFPLYVNSGRTFSHYCSTLLRFGRSYRYGAGNEQDCINLCTAANCLGVNWGSVIGQPQNTWCDLADQPATDATPETHPYYTNVYTFRAYSLV